MAVPAESPETLARLADLNLSPAELASFRRKFDVIDINKDGAITLRELFTISRVFGYKFTVEELTVRVDSGPIPLLFLRHLPDSFRDF